METLQVRKRSISSAFSDSNRPDRLQKDEKYSRLIGFLKGKENSHGCVISPSPKPSVISLIDDIEQPVTEPTVSSSSKMNVVDLSMDNEYEVCTADTGDEEECAANRRDPQESAEPLDVCLICDCNLSSLCDFEKEKHLQECLDSHGVDSGVNENHGVVASSLSPANCADIEERGLRLPAFYCVICDVDLSKRSLLPRCMHLKRCARNNRLTTKQLLQFIAPVFEDHDEEIDEDEAPGEGKDCGETCGGGSKDCAEKKNALTVMMSAAKDHSRLKGMFAATAASPLISKDIKGATKIPQTSSSSSSSAASAKQARAFWASNLVSARTSTSGKSAARSSSSSARRDGNYSPAYKKIQLGAMTRPIIVDGFQYSSPLLTDTYFLTHFHSDHYIGLSADFSDGKIYCSTSTAALVRLRIKVAQSRLEVLELDREYELSVGGMRVLVTLTDANHCPGAVCILFHFPSLHKSVLHTGDFRWNSSQMLRSSSVFRSLAEKASSYNQQHLTVYLDTTYCDVNYAFPHQDKAINAVIDCIREEVKRPGALFVFGAYAIGKERVFMAAAEELNAKVFVDKTRWKSMLCFDWPTSQQAMLTTDPVKTNVWVVSMNNINFNSLEKLRRQHPTCTRVVAFQPTGWTHQGQAPPSQRRNAVKPMETTNDLLHQRRKEGHVIYSVAYSEHSSFSELVDFVSTFRPARIVPTVNTSGEKVDSQLQLLKRHSQVYEKPTVACSANSSLLDDDGEVPLHATTSLGRRQLPPSLSPQTIESSTSELDFVSEFS